MNPGVYPHHVQINLQILSFMINLWLVQSQSVYQSTSQYKYQYDSLMETIPRDGNGNKKKSESGLILCDEWRRWRQWLIDFSSSKLNERREGGRQISIKVLISYFAVLTPEHPLCGDNINERGRPSGSDGICAASVGLLLDSYKASIILVFLSIAMLAICNGLVAHFYRNITDQGTSRSSCEHGVPPKPRNNVWVQISFVRKSRMGYAIVQKLELLLPRLVVWLDVDNLYNMDKLGMSVIE